ncbi:MAG: hypothetical protein KF832_27645 [Caldilineaceae bacterium]|nr:hypothetical protein [Caldilineaceae bacterium]
MLKNTAIPLILLSTFLFCSCSQNLPQSTPKENYSLPESPANQLSSTPLTITLPINEARPPVEITLQPFISQLAVKTTQVELPTVGSIASDKTHIYWTTDGDPGHIFRRQLRNGETETIVSTQFDKGNLTVLPLIRASNWLIFLDAQSPNEGTPYVLRAHNLRDGRDIVILENKMNRLLLPDFNAQAEQVVLTFVEFTDRANCTDTVLALYDLQAEQYQEIERTCAENAHMWHFPSLSGNRIVVEQDLSDAEGGGNNIYLYQIDTGQFTKLTDNDHSSMPHIGGNWVTWKDAPRFETAKRTVLLNLANGEKQVVPLGYDTAYVVEDRWLYWKPIAPLQALYVYDLHQKWSHHLAQSMDRGKTGSI